MKYTVVRSIHSNQDRALQELFNEVNRMIETGWKPLGGVSFSPWGSFAHVYSQAMVYQQTQQSS